MSWLSGLSSKRIKVTWQYSTKGFLWRLVPTDNGYLVLEDRDTEKKLATFTCLDQRTGKTLWKDVQFDEKWWITIDTIHHDVVFLHGYASPDMPEEKKIFAVDIHTGKLRWFNDEMKFLLIHDENVYACKDGITERQFYELDLNTGNIKKEINEDAVDSLRRYDARDVSKHLRFPNVFHNELEEPLLKDSVNRATQKTNNVTLIEYLEEGSYVVIGYYENTSANPTQQVLRQHITVMDRETKRILFSDTVTEDAAIAVPETFFSTGSFLYYIKNKQALTALNLSAN
jgi:hypothetical protein